MKPQHLTAPLGTIDAAEAGRIAREGGSVTLTRDGKPVMIVSCPVDEGADEEQELRATLDRLLSLRVDLRDEKACAEITPEQAAGYLTGKGWTEREMSRVWRDFRQGDNDVRVPRQTHWVDYGVRVVELIRALAEHEGRSPLAVWLDMKAAEAAPLVTETPPLLSRLTEHDATPESQQ